MELCIGTAHHLSNVQALIGGARIGRGPDWVLPLGRGLAGQHGLLHDACARQQQRVCWHHPLARARACIA